MLLQLLLHCVCGNVCAIWKEEGMREVWKAVWAGRGVSSLASLMLCVFAGMYFSQVLMYIVLVCCICDRKGKEERFVCCSLSCKGQQPFQSLTQQEWQICVQIKA